MRKDSSSLKFNDSSKKKFEIYIRVFIRLDYIHLIQNCNDSSHISNTRNLFPIFESKFIPIQYPIT